MEGKRNSARFWLGFLALALVLMGAAAFALHRLGQYAAAYDQSLPLAAARQYEADQFPGGLQAAIHRCAEESIYESPETVRSALTAVLTGDLTCRETVDPGRFTLWCGDREIGTLTLERQTGDFGLDRWQVAETALDLSALTSTVTVVAPAAVEVSVNGTPLSPDAATGETLWYPELAAFTDDLPATAIGVVYEVSGLYAPAAVTGTLDGQTCTAVTEASGRVLLYPAADEDTSSALLDLSGRFLDGYLAYANKLSGAGAALACTVPGSELAYRIASAADGLVWVRPGWSTVSDVSVDSLAYFGGCAVTQGHYTVEILDDDEILHNDLRILLTETPSGWRVLNMETF